MLETLSTKQAIELCAVQLAVIFHSKLIPVVRSEHLFVLVFGPWSAQRVSVSYTISQK